MLKKLLAFSIPTINTVFSFIEIILAFRVLFRLFGANPNNPVINFTYQLTDPLLFPFSDLFKPVIIGINNVLELNTIAAIITYTVVGWLAIHFILNMINAVSANLNTEPLSTKKQYKNRK